jgi:hypothetical protein
MGGAFLMDLMKKPMPSLIGPLLELNPTARIMSILIKFTLRIFLKNLPKVGEGFVILPLTKFCFSHPINGRPLPCTIGIVLDQFLKGLEGIFINPLKI